MGSVEHVVLEDGPGAEAPLVPDTIDRALLVRVFEYLAHISAECADGYLHSAGPEYREIYPGFRQDMVEGHVKNGRTYLELAEQIRTGQLDIEKSYVAHMTIPSALDTLNELNAREAECANM